ncbi:glucokinase [Oculatella sp. LEGE 06141]|uniref:glucokinase n=1 Tax=Oculatella sp. LEGE 06141 TaxID=1828648 RepID=UPI001882B911|nr:glucokinase [Oculatella sp. LEGE 06141]MBE9179153.1 glucokinase [Oculatella sp. LEGE 06141]
MTQLLAGDIGGTKTILRLVEVDAGAITSADKMKTLHEARYPSQEFPDLVPMVTRFLAAAAETGTTPAPQKACFAIAGPVVDNTSALTNLSWSLDANRLESELSIASVSLINDFVAVGYGVLGLDANDLHVLQAGKPDPEAPIAVIGAGTGLGQGFLTRSKERCQVFPSEGGHADFAPRSELEFQLLKYLLEKHDIRRISVERVVSGLGIVSIYQFLRDRHVAPEAPDVAQVVRTWESEIGKGDKSVDPAAAIAKSAAAGSDRLSAQTMNLFAEAYGAEAGNFALKLLPYGGLFLAGGIAAKNLPLLSSGGFLKAFHEKGRVSPVLEKVPVYIILNPQVGLIGAAIRAAQL